MSNIHPTAIIEDGAKIGENVTIGAFVRVSSKASIGDRCIIESHTVIDGKTTIGTDNHIFSHAVIGSIPQDLKYAGEEVELIIGNHNKIREFTLFNPGTAGGGSVTKIGNNNLFMGFVHLGHDVIIGNRCILANGATLAGHVELGDNVVIGGLTPIHQFVHIGDFAMIAGASALSQDVPPYCLAEGNRAILRGLNLIGLRRHINKEDINKLKIVYRKLFESGEPLQESVERLLKEKNSKTIKNLLEFVAKSKRGIPFTRKNING
ncbi:Acyl-[acyl-carrier-protein]--UDP-N-acetylglucosamine O-acyltransferase [hydrothermal vent metagenome]|uniref:Acyl-[acyl-carrier-protein]--UDP-N-acetylglucosamine O-acyltransferase n=1 Tax=hydrothermal vent metagenome TaxID=652676 RepID=A0A1W1BWQ5_9ZZZZ